MPLNLKLAGEITEVISVAVWVIYVDVRDVFAVEFEVGLLLVNFFVLIGLLVRLPLFAIGFEGVDAAIFLVDDREDLSNDLEQR